MNINIEIGTRRTEGAKVRSNGRKYKYILLNIKINRKSW
jgi:hypothetical protein